MSKIYIIGAGTIGRALAGVLQRNRRDVVLVRASEAVPRSLLRIAVFYEGVPIEEEVAVCGLQDIVRFDGVVVVATKSYGNSGIAAALRGRTGDSPVVIMQNGLGVEEAFLREGIGNVYRCVLFATSQYRGDGGVVFKPVTASPIGVVDGSFEVLSSVVDAINTPVFPFVATTDITPIAWSKTIANCVFNSVCPLLETDNGIFHRNGEALGLAKKMIAECIAVAELEGIRISAEEVTARLLLISKSSDGQLISTLQDIRSGRPTEIDTLNFAIARAAEAKGREVPITKALGELVRLKSFLAGVLVFVFLFVFGGCRGPVTDGSAGDGMGFGAGSGASSGLLSVRSMQDDLSVLWGSIQEIHPAYGMYTSRDSMLRLYNRTASLLDKPMPENEFIAAVYPLISALKCGHTQLKHSEGYEGTAAMALTPHLPFEVLVRDGKVWVTTHQVKEVKTGDELLAINNVLASEIVRHGSDLYAGDGNNKTFKELFLSEYDGFEDACNKYYHWMPPYRIALRSAGGELKTVSVDTVSAAAKQAEPMAAADNYKGWTVSSNTYYLPLRFLGSVACFEVHSYQYSDTVIFAKAFEEIRAKGVKDLIIDLRHNTGGDIRVGAKLLTYLADGPFQMVGNIWTSVPDPAKSRYAQYFDTARTESFYQSFKPTGIVRDGHYEYDFRPAFGLLLGKTALDRRSHYGGNLFVLIDGATFSAGAHTAAVIRQYCRKAVFIGREAAGGSEGCSGGTLQHMTLPNTGVVVEFPWLRLESILKNPVAGRGIIPDFIVEYTPQDVVRKEDVDMERVMELIRGKVRLNRSFGNYIDKSTEAISRKK